MQAQLPGFGDWHEALHWRELTQAGRRSAATCLDSAAIALAAAALGSLASAGALLIVGLLFATLAG